MKRPYSAWCVFLYLCVLTQQVEAQGNAISFDGYNDYLYASGFNWNSGGPVTIEFWSYVASTNVQMSQAFRVGADSISNRFVSSAPWVDSKLYWDYGNINTTGRISIDFTEYLNQWVHIALVSEGAGGSFKAIYINGVLAASSNSSDGTSGVFTGLYIGGKPGEQFHKGKIDEFRIWNTVRTQQQILDNKGQTIPGNSAGLAAYYTFDESSGSTVFDESEHGNHAVFGDSLVRVVSDVPFGRLPVISTVTPSLNGNNIDTDVPVSVTFDTEMIPSSLNSATFLVHGSVSGKHTGSISMSAGNSVCTFTPAMPFKHGEVVTVTLTKNIQSADSIYFLSGYSWQFRIKALGGPKSFVTGTTTSTGSSPFDLIVFDADMDGDADVVSANWIASTFTVLKNDGIGNFSGADYPAGGQLLSISNGDYDGDGDADIVLGVYGGAGYYQAFWIKLNNGSGMFSDGQRIDVNMFVESIVSVDVDNDGDIDLALGSNEDGIIQIYKNNGNGTFSLHQSIPSPFSSGVKLTAGHFNSNGFIDLIAGFSSGWGVLTNSYDGTFVLSTFSHGAVYPSVTGADFNNNGVLDVAIVGTNLQYIGLFWGSGSVSFPASTNIYYDSLIAPSDIASSDFDGDGDLDILVSNNHFYGRIAAIENDASGQWSTKFSIGNIARRSAIESVDLNNDGILDIVCAIQEPSNVQIYMRTFVPASMVEFPSKNETEVTINWNNGNGSNRAVFISQVSAGSPAPVNGLSYTASSVYGSGSQIGSSGWYCIYNSDGNSVTVTGLTQGMTYRIAVVEYAGGPGHEYYYPQSGTNNPRNVVPMHTTPLVSPVVEPLSGSNNISRSNSIKAFYNQPMNPDSFNVRTFIVYGSISGRHYGSYTMSNGDSACSFVSNRLFHPGEEVSVVLTEKVRSITDVTPTRGFSWRFTVKTNAAPKQFATGTLSGTGNNPVDIIAIDVDADGDADLVTQNFASHNITVQINDGAGNFTPYSYACGTFPYSITSGDFDNDGDIDVAVGSYAGVRLMMNNGAGVFTGGEYLMYGSVFGLIAAGDIDNDGDIDLVGANADNYEIYVAKNNGAGSFTLTQSTWGAYYYPRKLILADFDSGGDVDLMVGFETGWHFFANTGGGNFSGANYSGNYGKMTAMTAADLNNNGTMDIAVSNFDVPYTNINYGSGAWTFSGTQYLNEYYLFQSSDIASGDLDGDADIDLFIPNNYSQGKIVVWDNIQAGAGYSAYLVGAGSPHSSIAAADLDGDGMLDMVCANYSQNLIQTYVHTVTQASSLVNTTSALQSTISWTNGNGGSRVVFIKEDTTGSPSPLPLTTYTASTVYGSGSQIGGGWYCIYNGTGNSVTVTGLTKGKTYRVAVMEYAGAAGNENYFAKTGNNNPVNITTSEVASYNVTVSVISGTQVVVNWTKGNGSKRVVFAALTSAGNPSPENNVTYTANTAYGNGTQIHSSGWYCVYNDTGSSVTVSGLSAGNIYRFAIADYAGNPGSEEYFTATGAQNPVNSPILSAPPAVLSITPANNTRLAEPNTTITATFNTTVLRDSINQRTFRVYGSQTGWHTGEFSFSNGDSVVTFTSNAIFKRGETVNYTLTNNIVNTGGQSLPLSLGYTFIIKGNDAAGTFTYTGLTYTENNPQGLFTADFDNDGDLDIATGNRDAGSVNILKNNGSGAFNLTQYIYPGDQAAYITGADFDNDGDIDLAVVLIGEAKVGILTNNGGGNFTLGQLVATASMPHNITVGDFTGDGIPDLGVAHWGGEAMSILGNNGSGSFSVHSELTGIGVTGALCAGDFDGDGDIDVATSHYFESAVRVHLNNGSGFFTTYGYYGNIANPYILNSGDLNGDGFLDIAIAAIGENNVAVLMNNSSALFSISKVGAGPGTHGVSIGDIRGNGFVDIIAANISGNSASILTNNGSGSFTSATENFSFGTFLPVIADFNNDGRLDYVILSHTESAVYTFINDAPAPLPVELASFGAFVQEGKVLLNWSTATEVNNAGFEVEKCMNAGNNPEAAGNLLWEKIGFVAGAGNSNSVKEYRFADNNGRVGTYLFRLKQIDTDGKYAYTKIISAEVTAPREFTLAQNYPNPFNPSTRIDYQIPETGFVTMKLYNIAGEEVRGVFSGVKEAGFHSELVTADGLSSGVYLYILTLESTHGVKRITKKLTLLR